MSGWRYRPAKPVRPAVRIPLWLEVSLWFGMPVVAIVMTAAGSAMGLR